MPNIDGNNTQRSHNVQRQAPQNNEGILTGILRGIRVLFSHPLTLAAGLAMTLPLPAFGAPTPPTRREQEGQGTSSDQSTNTALQTVEHTVTQAARRYQSQTDTTTSANNAMEERYELPVDVSAVTSAARHAQQTGETVNVGWMLYDNECESELRTSLFNNNATAEAEAVTWRAEVGQTVHMLTRLTPQQTARALSITIRDALTGEGCVENMYVDAFDSADVVNRLETRENVLENTVDPDAQAQECLSTAVRVEGRGVDGRSTLQGYLESCAPRQTVAPTVTVSSHVRARRDLDLTEMSSVSEEITETSDQNTAEILTTPNATILEQLTESIAEIREQFCPNNTNIIHGNTTIAQRELANLQAQLTALCPNITIIPFSSLNTSSPSPFLGPSQLLEQLSGLLESNSTDDVFIISPPRLHGERIDTEAIEQIISVLTENDIEIFSANADGWVSEIGGIQHGGDTAQQIVHKRSRRSAESQAEQIDNLFPQPDEEVPSSLPTIIVMGSIAVILATTAAAGMVWRNRRTAQQRSQAAAQARNVMPLYTIHEELDALVSESDSEKEETEVDVLLPQRTEDAAHQQSLSSRLSEDRIFSSSSQLVSVTYESDFEAALGVLDEEIESDTSEDDPLEGNSSGTIIVPRTRTIPSSLLLPPSSSPLTRTTSSLSLVRARSQAPRFGPIASSVSMQNLPTANETPASSSASTSNSTVEESTRNPQDDTNEAPIWPPCKAARSQTDLYRSQAQSRANYKDDENNDKKIEELRLQIEAMKKAKAKKEEEKKKE